MTADTASSYHQALQWWQSRLDDAFAQWFKTSQFLESMRLRMDRLLEWRMALSQIQQILWGDPLIDLKTYRMLLGLANESLKALAAGAEAMTGTTLLPRLGATPHEVVYREDKLRLLRYTSTQPRRYAMPVLIICSLINRYYKLDLTPGRSYVEHLLKPQAGRRP